MSYDAGDERQVKSRKQKVQDQEETYLADLKKLLQLPEGRRVLFRVLSYCQVYQEGFTGNSTSFYNDGKQSIGLRLIDDLGRVEALAYPKLMIQVNEDFHV